MSPASCATQVSVQHTQHLSNPGTKAVPKPRGSIIHASSTPTEHATSLAIPYKRKQILHYRPFHSLIYRGFVKKWLARRKLQWQRTHVACFAVYVLSWTIFWSAHSFVPYRVRVVNIILVMHIHRFHIACTKPINRLDFASRKHSGFIVHFLMLPAVNIAEPHACK